MRKRLTTLFLNWLTARPALLRELMLRLRSQQAVLQMGGQTVVLGYHEVQQVLQRPSDFTLAPLLRPRILSGDFLLSQDESAQYLNDKARMRQAFFGVDFDLIERIRRFAASSSQEILHRRGTGAVLEIDFVGELAEPVAAAVLYQQVIGFTDTPPDSFVAALRSLGKLIVSGDYDDSPEKKHEYDAAVSILLQLLETRLTDTAQTWHEGNVVARLQQVGCTHADIKRYIGGIAAAGVATIACAGGQALNELLHRPAALQLAQEAAQSENEAAMIQCTMEALRYNPMFHFIVRRCELDTQIECQDGRIVPVQKHSQVMLGLHAAMFDALAFPDPQRFMITRPRERYLHFGDGMHRCFGERIAHVQIAQITMALLRHCPTVSRNRQHGRGYLEYEGPALRHLMVRCS